MGRRNDHSREELRTMAVAAASDIVAAEGLRGLTTRKVAARLGYSPGSLYVIFRNLDDLILHTNAHTLEELRTELGPVASTATTPAATLRALAHGYLEFARNHTNRWLAIFEHRFPEDGDVPDWYRDDIASVMGLVRRPVAQLRGVTDPAAIDLETTAVWGAVHGVVVLGVDAKLDAGGARAPKAVLDTLLTTLCS